MSYSYTNGDGPTVLLVTEPNGATEPVSNLDDAVKQIKKWINDPTSGKGAVGLFADVAALTVSRGPFSASMGSNQALGASAKLLFNTDVYDPGSVYDATNSKYVVPSTGFYGITAGFAWNNAASASPTGLEFFISIKVNGSSKRYKNVRANTDVAGGDIEVNWNGSLTVADVVEVYGGFNIGTGTATFNTDNNVERTFFSGARRV